MRIYIDISHPAYAHSLAPLIMSLKKLGFALILTARQKDLTQYLLSKYEIHFRGRGKGQSLLSGKATDVIRYILKFFYSIRKFNPDIIISFSSYHASILGWLLRKPVITLEDTEEVALLHTINRLFSTYMITPHCFEKDFGKKHIRFKGYKELAFLHPNRFTPKPKIQAKKPYILLRFVSWKAWHDHGHSGISLKMKEKLIAELKKYADVYISSETELPDKWKQYELTIVPEDIHSFMAGASLIFAESASMSAEAAVLGVPAIFIDDTGRGYTRDLENKYDLMYNYGESDEEVEKGLAKAKSILSDPNSTEEWQSKRKIMLSEKDDVTEWLVNFVEKIGERGRFETYEE